MSTTVSATLADLDAVETALTHVAVARAGWRPDQHFVEQVLSVMFDGAELARVCLDHTDLPPDCAACEYVEQVATLGDELEEARAEIAALRDQLDTVRRAVAQ